MEHEREVVVCIMIIVRMYIEFGGSCSIFAHGQGKVS